MCLPYPDCIFPVSYTHLDVYKRQMLQGVTFADYNDLESVKAAVTENTYAIIVEAVQGEGGIYPANAEFLQGIRKLCDENDIIMICDEIQ